MYRYYKSVISNNYYILYVIYLEYCYLFVEYLFYIEVYGLNNNEGGVFLIIFL